MPRHYINPDSPRVSVILIREHFDKRIHTILSSIQKNTYPYFEVIVMNIGAPDRAVKDLYKHFPNLKQLTLNPHTEKEYALSEGVKIAQGEFLIFLNNVEEINQDFIQELVQGTKKSNRIAIVTPQVRSFKNKELCLYSAQEQPRGLSTFIDYGIYRASAIKEDSSKFTHFPCRDAFLISMEYLRKAEERKKDFLFLLDEIDIAETIREERFKIYYQPNAVAYLNIIENADSIYYKTRNRLASIRRHKHGAMLIAMLLLFGISSIPKHTLHHLIHFRLDHVFAFYRGVLWNMFHSVKAGGLLSHFKWKHPF